MKYGYILVLGTVSLMAFNAFGESEMDSEINDLQVRIIHVKPPSATKKVARPTIEQEVTPKIYTYSARPAIKTAVSKPVRANFYKPTVVAKPTYVATTAGTANDSSVAQVNPVAPAPSNRHEVDNNGNTNNFQAAEKYQAYESQPEETVSAPAPKTSKSSGQFVRRIELIPAFTISSFDGGDSSTLQPNGVSNTYNSALSATLLSDIDFGNSHFFVESGFMLSQMGAGTGVNNQNGFTLTPTPEKESLTYIGVPLYLKFRLRDQEDSSFFIKAGGTPVYMIGHAYSISGASAFNNPEQRFGAYNTFDLLLGAGVGYDYKVWRDFHAVVDISAFQGLFPVLTNFSVFNYGVNLGLGVAYML